MSTPSLPQCICHLSYFFIHTHCQSIQKLSSLSSRGIFSFNQFGCHKMFLTSLVIERAGWSCCTSPNTVSFDFFPVHEIRRIFLTSVWLLSFIVASLKLARSRIHRWQKWLYVSFESASSFVDRDTDILFYLVTHLVCTILDGSSFPFLSSLDINISKSTLGVIPTDNDFN